MGFHPLAFFFFFLPCTYFLSDFAELFRVHPQEPAVHAPTGPCEGSAPVESRQALAAAQDRSHPSFLPSALQTEETQVHFQ